MNGLAPLPQDSLPQLIDRAASALSGARTSAEVLEARDMARVAYDAAKTAGRMARAKAAHDEVIAAVYRAQADAAVIEARAKVRLADEYDEAQRRGEVAKLGDNLPSVGVDNAKPATAADLGLRRDEIHEARKLRDAEAEQPGKIEAAAQALVDRGEEPTKAALRREVIGTQGEDKAVANNPDPFRAGLSSLSRQGLEDEVAGLRAALADEAAKRKTAEAERDRFKAANKELTSTDAGRIIAKLQAENRAMRYSRDEAQKAAKREEYKRRLAEKELARITGQEISFA